MGLAAPRADASKAALETGMSRAVVGGIIAMAVPIVGIAGLIADSPPSIP